MRLLSIFPIGGLLFAGAQAQVVASPKVYDPTLWQGKSEAVLRVLTRVDSHVELLKIPVGGETTYKTLQLTLQRCLVSPATAPENDAAQVTIRDSLTDAPAFVGWLLSKEPFLSNYESPVYDISLVSCSGADATPFLPALPAESSPASAEGKQQKFGPTGAPTTPTRRVAPPARQVPMMNGGPLQLAPPLIVAPPQVDNDLPPPQ